MSVHIKSDNMDVWDFVINGRFELQIDVGGVMKNKPKTDWIDYDKKKAQYNLKARNILI